MIGARTPAAPALRAAAALLLLLGPAPSLAFDQQRVIECVPVCETRTGGPVELRPDGEGGAYLLWWGSSGLFLQRFGPDGTPDPRWPACGVLATSDPDQYPMLRVSADGDPMVGWFRRGSYILKRFTQAGGMAAGWPAEGRTLMQPSGHSGYQWPSFAPDGLGGAFFSVSYYIPYLNEFGIVSYIWNASAIHVDETGDNHAFYDLRPCCSGQRVHLVAGTPGVAFLITESEAQLLRLEASGAMSTWLDLTRSAPNTGYVDSAPDGSGGVYVLMFSSTLGYFASHVGADGALLPGWGPERPLLNVADRYGVASMSVDPSGGLTLAWSDARTGAPKVHVQRFDAVGDVAPGWPAEGVSVSDDPAHQSNPLVTHDGSGGAYVVWSDWESMGFAQHVRGDGTLSQGFGSRGVTLCARSVHSHQLAPLGSQSALSAWYDDGSPHGGDAGDHPYSAVIAEPVTLAVDVAATSRLSLRAPSPIRGVPITVTVELPEGGGALELIDVTGRRLERRELSHLGPGVHTVSIGAERTGPGLYLLRLSQADGAATARIVTLD